MLHLSVAVLIALASVPMPGWVSALDSDNVFITAVSGVSCSNNNPFLAMTACADRKACISAVQVCDGRRDCDDGSDETSVSCYNVRTNICPTLDINGSQFQCKYGGTVEKEKVCDGTNDCADGSDEAECRRCHCKSSSSAYFKCDYGACIEKSKRCDGTTDCVDGSDETGCQNPPIDRTERPKTSTTTTSARTTTSEPGPPPENSCRLPPHPAHGTNVVLCKFADRRNCPHRPGEEVAHGTRLITDCHFKYTLAAGNGFSVCFNGVWRPPYQTCTACGVSGRNFDNYEDLLLIRNGEDSEPGDFPWMVALYRKNKAGRWEQVCGGTLISPYIVLTAAHCVTNGRAKIQPEEIMVGLGKINRDYYRQEPTGSVISVREVVVPPRYVGPDHNYDLDVALLALAGGGVPLSPHVCPACLDLGGRLSLRHGVTGYLAGWGATESGRTSEELQWARHNFVEYESCLEKVGPTNVRFLTHDKFCVIGASEAKPDHGDSGGGLTFTRDGVHFVMGIVSSTFPRNGLDQPVVLFTNLHEHRNWISDQRQRLTLRHTIY